jgi:NAD(P)-dependent dehydrogenase (short-subunit alcohol dehydrogenase family)
MADFGGKTLIVTGGATGLGAAVAARAAGLSAKVAILDVDEAAGRETARTVGGRFIACDVADPRSWASALDEVESRLGPIRYAHLNAGIMTAGRGAGLGQAKLENVSPERYRAVLGVNIDGVFFGLQALLPRMVGAGGDAITVTSSAAGLIPIPFDPVYALTKHAIVGLVRSLALASAGGPVRINAICPGGFASALVPPELRAAVMMSADEMAAETIDLMLHGASGETRLKLRADAPAQAVAPPLFALG